MCGSYNGTVKSPKQQLPRNQRAFAEGPQIGPKRRLHRCNLREPVVTYESEKALWESGFAFESLSSLRRLRSLQVEITHDFLLFHDWKHVVESNCWWVSIFVQYNRDQGTGERKSPGSNKLEHCNSKRNLCSHWWILSLSFSHFLFVLFNEMCLCGSISFCDL